MFEFIIAIVGLFIGCLLSYISPEEMKAGEKYFKLICYLTVLALIIIGFVYSFNIWLFIAGLILGFIFYNEYFYFGIFSASSLITGTGNILASSLVFIYGLPSGSLLFYQKRYLGLVSNVVLFFIPFLLYFININLIPLATGGLIGLTIRRLKNKKLF